MSVYTWEIEIPGSAKKPYVIQYGEFVGAYTANGDSPRRDWRCSCPQYIYHRKVCKHIVLAQTTLWCAYGIAALTQDVQFPQSEAQVAAQNSPMPKCPDCQGPTVLVQVGKWAEDLTKFV